MKSPGTPSDLARAVVAAALVVVTLAALVSCAKDNSEQAGAESADADQITIVFAHQTEGQKEIAEASHAFDDTAYKVEWATLKTAPEVAQAVQSGAATIGVVGDLTPILLASNAETPWTKESAPFKVAQLTAVPNEDLAAYPAFQLVASDASGIKTYADLRGKKVAFQSGGTINLYALRLLASAGLTPADIDHVELDTRSGASALIAGSVDAWIGNAQFVPSTIAGGGHVVGTSNDPQVYTPSLVPLLVDPQALNSPEENKALADFFQRLDDQSQWRKTHSNEVADIYKQALHVDDATAAIYASSTNYVSYPIGPDVLAQQQRLADELLERQFIKREVDVSTYYDDQFSQLTKDSYARLGWNLDQITIPNV